MSANLTFTIPLAAPHMPLGYSAIDILKIVQSESPALYSQMVFAVQRHAAMAMEFQNEQSRNITPSA